MPTYEDLRAYFEESGDLKNIAREASSVPIVKGFTLNVDPLWSLLYDVENDLLHLPASRLRELEYWFFRNDPFGFENYPPHSWLTTRYQGYRRRNLYASVKDWDKLKGAIPNRELLPVIMTIVHRPVRPTRQDLKEVEEDQESLSRLGRLVRSALVPIRLEERPPARLALAGGDRLTTSTGKSGTLGGVVDDRANGISYAVTCDHVAQIGDLINDGLGKIIGRCSANTARIPMPAPIVCDPISLAVPAPIPSNGPAVNMLDCALIELSAPITRSPIADIATSISPGQSVILHGATTGTTHHKLGSLALSYSFSEHGQDFCFRDSIELLPQSWGPVGGMLGHMMTTMPTKGDSGGWILTDDNPPYWAGLFFAEDGHRGFLIRASWVHQWAERTVGCKLQL